MQKQFLFLILLFSTIFGHSQILDGTYIALELNGLNVDTSGKVDFFMKDSFPNQKWFHRVEVTINGNNIVIRKTPVFTDSTGKLWHSASDGGFLTYKGKITKTAGLYIAKTQLSAFDYIGFSTFEPPIIAKDADSSLLNKPSNNKKRSPLSELRKTHDVTKGVNGLEVFLPKGIIRQNFIITPERNDLLINNVYYIKAN
jgi:hypothetical protein